MLQIGCAGRGRTRARASTRAKNKAKTKARLWRGTALVRRLALAGVKVRLMEARTTLQSQQPLIGVALCLILTTMADD